MTTAFMLQLAISVFTQSLGTRKSVCWAGQTRSSMRGGGVTDLKGSFGSLSTA